MKKVLLLLVLVLAIPVAAQPLVEFHQFYGDAIDTLDDWEIQAHVNENVYVTKIKEGEYGYSPLFLVGKGNDGDEITFYIKTRQVDKVDFIEGGVTELDLEYKKAPGEVLKKPKKKPPTPSVSKMDCFDDWFCQPYGVCIGGTQTRVCVENDYPDCELKMPRPSEEQACEMPIPGATCTDGIQNQGEKGIDCSGPCAPCPNCFDGIRNQGEVKVDCGGPCAPCPPIVEVPAVVIEEKASLWWLWLLLGIFLLVGLIIGAIFFFEKRHKEEPHDERFKDVAPYVAEWKAKGASKHKIEQALIKQGWKKEDIKKLL